MTLRLLLGAAAGLMLMPGCAPDRQVGLSTAAPEEPPVRWLLACRMSNYGRFQEAGWAHVAALGVQHVFIEAPAPEEVERTRERLASHHLSAVVLRGNADFSQDSAVEQLTPQLQTCARLGVGYLFLSVKGHWPDLQRKMVYERLRRAGEVARRHGVVIAIETHPELGTNADVQLETMRQVNHPNVRINFDTGNITYYNRGTDAVAELRRIVDYVATVEIKDHDGQFESWHFPALGRGQVDIPAILRILRRHGYEGPITIEVEGIKGVDRDEAHVRRDIEESVACLRRLGSFE